MRKSFPFFEKYPTEFLETTLAESYSGNFKNIPGITQLVTEILFPHEILSLPLTVEPVSFLDSLEADILERAILITEYWQLLKEEIQRRNGPCMEFQKF